MPLIKPMLINAPLHDDSASANGERGVFDVAAVGTRLSMRHQEQDDPVIPYRKGVKTKNPFTMRGRDLSQPRVARTRRGTAADAKP
jgi:hypothetical protein